MNLEDDDDRKVSHWTWEMLSTVDVSKTSKMVRKDSEYMDMELWSSAGMVADDGDCG